MWHPSVLSYSHREEPLCCVTTIPHCPGYTELPALEDVGPSLIHSSHPCAWPLQENCQRAIDLVCTKLLSDSNRNSQSSLQGGGFDWCVIGIPTRLPMWSLLLHSEKLPNAFHLNKSHTGEVTWACVLGGCTVLLLAIHR